MDTKRNFVRSGTVVYFDAVSVEEAIRLSQEHGDNGTIDALKKVKKQSKLLQRLHRKGECLEGKSGVANQRRLLDMAITKETKMMKQLEKECFVGNYNSKRHVLMQILPVYLIDVSCTIEPCPFVSASRTATASRWRCRDTGLICMFIF